MVIKNGHFVGDVPVGDSLWIKKQLDDMQSGFAGGDNGLVILAEVLSELTGEQFVVGFTDDFCLVVKTEPFEESEVGTDNFEVGVFGKKGDSGQVVEKVIK
ncbi:MAG: hypothetical protein L3J63_13435 [Geopsychrobacter sp.]|nr:hypothetical protein [Geopsychrobacter sp.]